MAYESMWITVASSLASIAIDKVKGPDGLPITPKGDYICGFLWYALYCSMTFFQYLNFSCSYPKPFECDIHPRSDEHRALIEETASIL